MVRVRFAPSPTGIPHIGNTRTALYNYLFAKHHQGKFILRIEDTDKQRLVPGSLEKILQILQLVGIKWDEGPSVNGPHSPYIQSQRLKLYQQHAQDLIKKKAAYHCFCSPERLKEMRLSQQKKGQPPKYDRRCLKLSPSTIQTKLAQKTPHVIRLKVPDQGQTSWTDLIQKKIEFENKLLDDQVLLKSDGYPTYHLAVVVDDHLMKISHILRGVEWISSTPKHILLFQAFGWPIPQMGHFPIILGPDKAKLSKRHGAKSALDYQQEGYLPQALITFMAYLGWSHQDNSQLLSMNQLIKLFDLKKVQASNSIFDPQKLDYFNAKCIRSLSVSKLAQLIKPFLKLKPKLSPAKLKQILPLIQERMVKLADINLLTEYFVKAPQLSKKAILKESKLKAQATANYLKQAADIIQSISPWSVKNIQSDLHQLQEKSGLKVRPAFMTIRLAVTGRSATPPLFDILAIIGQQEVINRLTHAQKILRKK